MRLTDKQIGLPAVVCLLELLVSGDTVAPPVDCVI